MRKQFAFACVVLLSLTAACGGGSGGSSSSSTPSTPTSPSTPTPPANRAPTITSMNFAPTFGIAQLTQFSFNAAASDPDGDSISYAWDVAGNPFTGTNGTITFAGGGNATATLTVTDSKGATATDSRQFVVGSATGTWSGSGVGLGNFTMSLTQSGPAVTGTYNDAAFGAGKIDPAQPGSINGAGHIEMRMKQGIFTDFTFKGDMDQTGRRITGQIFGSGFNGQAFTMTKQ